MTNLTRSTARERNHIRQTVRGSAGLSTIREANGMTNIVGPHKRRDGGFWAVITGYHVTEVDNSNEDGPDRIEELFYLWEQVELVNINKEEDGDGPIFNNSVNATRVTKQDNEEPPLVKSEVDQHNRVINILLDTHGCIPVGEYVWVEPTTEVYVWEGTEESGTYALDSPIYRTNWQGLIRFECDEMLSHLDYSRCCLINRDTGQRIEQREIEVLAIDDHLRTRGSEHEDGYVEATRGSRGVAYACGDKITAVSVEPLPEAVLGILHEDVEEDDDYLYLDWYLLAVVAPHGVDDIWLDRFLETEGVYEGKLKVNNTFNWAASETARCKAVWNHSTNEFMAVQVEC